MINRLSLLTSLAIVMAVPAVAVTPFTAGTTTGGVYTGPVYDSGDSFGYDFGGTIVGDTPKAGGSADDFFNLDSFTPVPFSGAATVVPPADNDPAWISSSPAQWIAPVENETGAVGSGSSAGVYDYQGSFSSDFLAPTVVTVSGSYAADDNAALYLNGILESQTPGFDGTSGNGFGALTPFNFTFTASAGMSIVPVQFIVDNLSNGPTGLLVTNLTFSYVTATGSSPEPSTWALLLGGLGLLVFARRRHFARL